MCARTAYRYSTVSISRVAVYPFSYIDFFRYYVSVYLRHQITTFIFSKTKGYKNSAELAQSVERTTLNRVVVGSIPTFGVLFLHFL